MDIKTIARQKGLMMKDIAARLGVTEGGLSKSLNGNPTLTTLRAVADVLQVPVSELFRDEVGDRPRPDREPLMQQTIRHQGRQLQITVRELE